MEKQAFFIRYPASNGVVFLLVLFYEVQLELGFQFEYSNSKSNLICVGSVEL